MHISGVAGSGRVGVTEIPQSDPLRETDEAARIRHDVAAARDVARSALTNERFRLMLDQIVNPALSDALLQMKSDGGGRTDLRSAELRYSETASD
ncbi:hypothetical protein [Pseudaminobacter salicylatoxidans]|uniref:hypothetical protein n=1 Tax=Pseudaminobacter salicylatoxidans TaxID=93369 RepID=UPI0002D54202|nr:hypothetical protein [Pseudaminobacter salicylatoxidans]